MVFGCVGGGGGRARGEGEAVAREKVNITYYGR